MKEHLETTRRHLGELGALADKTERAERDILERAHKRLDEVTSRIQELFPHVHTQDDAGQEYTDLVMERGRIERVIANANQVLEPA